MILMFCVLGNFRSNCRAAIEGLRSYLKVINMLSKNSLPSTKLNRGWCKLKTDIRTAAIHMLIQCCLNKHFTFKLRTVFNFSSYFMTFLQIDLTTIISSCYLQPALCKVFTFTNTTCVLMLRVCCSSVSLSSNHEELMLFKLQYCS